MILAAICNFIEIGEAAVKTQQAAGRSPVDLAAVEEDDSLPIGLQKFTVYGGPYRTPLSLAAEYGNEDMLQLLLKHDQNPNGDKNMALSPLMYAVSNGHMTIIHILLQQTNVNPDHQCHGGLTALSLAAGTGQLRAIQLLLRNFADPEKSDRQKETALCYTIGPGHVAVVNFLVVEEKVKCNGRDMWDQTPLVVAIKTRRTEIAEILLESGASSKTEDRDGTSPLSHAVLTGDSVMATLLLKHGADLESGGYSKKTPLIYAARWGHFRMVKLLLEFGTNPGVEDSDGETPLLYAARAEAYDTVHLLIEHGADPEQKNKYGRTALIKLIKSGFFAPVVFLLRKIKVDYNIPDGFGQTPLVYAVLINEEKIANLLLELGAKTEVADDNRTTALSHAVQNQYLTMTELLLKFGANSETVDHDGKTPLDYAKEMDHKELIWLLKSQKKLRLSWEKENNR